MTDVVESSTEFWIRRYKKLEAENKKLKEGLEWMIKNNRVKHMVFSGMPLPSKSERVYDGKYGKKAREILKELEK